ncbi:hypothetical protein PHLCEN_2v8814 [Hermanssonia centrifuga]|uniref:Uncharacterized protein n=1 Tax=Hermanssonia centrifuga TaxID=98765 RepID=A0A2R6NSK0_9APHY|nr:hypothetical protein PHLCEN_2v8814 [Hermanssonia centrifuga]
MDAKYMSVLDGARGFAFDDWEPEASGCALAADDFGFLILFFEADALSFTVVEELLAVGSPGGSNPASALLGSLWDTVSG